MIYLLQPPTMSPDIYTAHYCMKDKYTAEVALIENYSFVNILIGSNDDSILLETNKNWFQHFYESKSRQGRSYHLKPLKNTQTLAKPLNKNAEDCII